MSSYCDIPGMGEAGLRGGGTSAASKTYGSVPERRKL